MKAFKKRTPMKQLKNESNTTKINLVAKKKHKNMNNLMKLKSEK